MRMRKRITGIGTAVMTIAAAGMIMVSGCGSSNNPAQVNNTISGTVSGLNTAGVTIALSGGSNATTTTDANGNYRFTGLGSGTYNVTPGGTGYTFSPVTMTAAMDDCASMMGSGSDAGMMGDQQSNESGCSSTMTVINFTATSATGSTYSISGMITTPGRTMGSGLTGVTVTLSGAGYGTTTTTAIGMYTFSNLTPGSYALSPAKSGYAFTPVSSAQTISTTDIMHDNFIGTPNSAATYSLSGVISVSAMGMNKGLAGVTVTVGGSVTGSTTTDANGNYRLSGLVNGDYTVTPALSGFSFSPAISEQTMSGADITSIDFTATSN